MDRHLQECLEGREPGKYIFPFFWQHGEERQILLEELEAIRQSGIEEFCVESRVHPGFGEEQWWEDLEFLLQEAEKRGMRVWILDDKSFPSGYANGWIRNHPELRKVSLRLVYADVEGPVDGGAMLAEGLEEGESLLCAAAWKRKEEDVFSGEMIPLTQTCREGLLYPRLPEGSWRIFQVIRTRRSIPGKEDYIDLLSAQSCRAVIDGVYEPHYARLGRYFGTTLAGFFFDEPGFANEEGNYSSKLGKPGMLVPWNDALLALLAERLGKKEEETLLLLPLLWQEREGETVPFRIAYMELASGMARENYSRMLGEWCEKHGVLSVGHLIEDMNAHMRLGYGMGHYFRGLDGQDMAGMDIVLGQINPGAGCTYPAAPIFGGCADVRFFTYTLPKLAASSAHFSPRKQGRAMCEIFGAFGWAEGLGMMKELADRMLVRGINYYVPHAFSPKYPDPDCPPHFWARGNNPQYPYFKGLISYMRRCCHMLSDGLHMAQAAIAYQAHADWSGEDYFPMERLTKELTDSQIDYDILPEEELKKASGAEGKLKAGRETYSLLLVTDRAYWSRETVGLLEEMKEKNVEVWIVCDAVPKRHALEGVRYVPCSEIGELFWRETGEKRYLEEENREIRILHIRREGREVYALLNESRRREWEGTVRVDMNQGCLYDPWENRLYPLDIRNGKARLHLFPGELVFLTQGGDAQEEKRYEGNAAGGKQLRIPYQIEIRAEEGFRLYDTREELFDLTEAGRLPAYSGPIRYSGRFRLEEGESYDWLDLGCVGEVAGVWLNGKDCGTRISAPYCFRVRNALKEGWNELVIEVVNNVAYRERDGLSRYYLLPPSGLLGPVQLL